jgi:hypothetical protein
MWKKIGPYVVMLGGLALGTVAAAAGTTERTTTALDRQTVAVTIYNDDLALVKDARRVRLEQGANRLVWREVSAMIRPETAQLRNLGNPDGFHLVEQNFDFDLLTPQNLLEKHLGQEVTVIRTNPVSGEEERERATVLANNDGVVLRFTDRIETGVPGRLAFAGVPENLRDKPTLTVFLLNPAAGEQDLELSYLTGGLSWRADYVAELAAGDDRLDLNGWATLTNRSGASYAGARLQLVAGDVNLVRDPQTMGRDMLVAARMMEAAEMEEEPLFEYHLYSLPRLTGLADNQSKQVALLSAAGVAISKEFLLEGASYYYLSQHSNIGRKQKVGVFVEFKNFGPGLGIPLPKGIVRVYKKDSQGNAQFVGEDRLDHTARNQNVRLKLGEAFDVGAERKQTGFQRPAEAERPPRTYESAHEIVLQNGKNEAVQVIVREPVPGEWQMLSESHPHVRAAAGVAQWEVLVPAEGATTLAYRVRVRP